MSGPVDLVIRESTGEPVGAIVLNHGRGADEHDLLPLLDELDPERRLLGVTTGGPLRNLPPGGRHWYIVERVGYPDRETFDAGLAALAARVDGLLAERGIPWGRTIVGGFSQGAVMSYALVFGAGRPLPAGVVVLSGFIPVVEGWAPAMAGREGLPVYVHHGANDPVIGVAFARTARELLNAAGVDLSYRETAAGHWLPPEILPELRGFVERVAANAVSGEVEEVAKAHSEAEVTEHT